jgi:UDP-glucose/iron transport system permease protein
MTAVDIDLRGMLIGYLLLIFPLAIILWLRVPLLKDTTVAVLRMTFQLLFVGFYLQVIFQLNSPSLNALWLLAMIVVADISILRSCRLRLSRFGPPLFCALLLGTLPPLLLIVVPILQRPQILDAQYAIPLGGMILGNCLRADIMGIRDFYESIRKGERTFLLSLAQGASLAEATRPYFRDACHAALAPTVATMATIGLVSLPGMMTGVILGGANPMSAIKYQILIMLAIFGGTAVTVVLAIRLTMRVSFSTYGLLDRGIFRQ